jgi:hypothetical protein
MPASTITRTTATGYHVMTSMKHNTLAGLVFGTALLVATAAAQAGTFRIDYTTAGSPADSGVVILTTSDTLTDGAYTVLGVSGERDGYAITGLSPYASADQLLFAVGPYFDVAGVSFETAAGDYNLFAIDDGYYEVASTVDPIGFVNSGISLAGFTITEVPEPTSVALLTAGLISMGTVAGHRRRRCGPR